MPKVRPYETRGAYLARCIPIAMGEGLTQKQAVGKCEGMFSSARKEGTMKIIRETAPNPGKTLIEASVKDIMKLFPSKPAGVEKKIQLILNKVWNGAALAFSPPRDTSYD